MTVTRPAPVIIATAAAVKNGFAVASPVDGSWPAGFAVGLLAFCFAAEFDA